MANKIELSSIGTKVSIAIETTAGTKPVTNYYPIPKVTELPDLDFEPDTIETTSYDNLKYKSYLSGLMDTGGILSFASIYTEYGVEMWDDIADKLSPQKNTDGLKAWIMVDIKGTSRKWFIPIMPTQTGLPSAPVNDVVTINYNFTVVGDIELDNIADTAIDSYYATKDYAAA